MGFTLRPYQEEALEAVVDHVKRGARRLVIAIPTGGGKTVIFSHLAQRLGLGPSDKVLILAHRDELVQQAVNKYLEQNPLEMIGIEKESQRATPMDRVCVASVQTLTGKRLADFRTRWGVPSLIVTDEAHHAVSPSYADIYSHFNVSATGDVIHVGVTATPKRSDKVGLDKTFDAVAYSIPIGDLIKLGMLVPLVGYRVETRTSLEGVKITAGDFNLKQLSEAVDVMDRNAKIVQAYVDITPGRKAVVFAASVQHSRHLVEMFQYAGYRAAHIDGTTPEDERRSILQGFSRGDYQVLCNCAVLTEGWDEPSLEVVMIARPTASSVLYTQMIGRATRLYEGKKKAAVIDFVDATQKHSIMSLPSLLGLPPNFNLGGREAVRVAEAFTSLAEGDPMAASLITSPAMMERLANMSREERMSTLVRMLMEQAKEKHSYIPVNLFLPPTMPPEYDAYTYMVWQPQGDDRFVLRIRNERVVITGDLVGKYQVEVVSQRGATKHIGSYDHIRFAFAQAELWVRDFRGDDHFMVDKSAKWRREPATSKQVAALKKYRVEGASRMTKHEANAALDTIMQGIATGMRR